MDSVQRWPKPSSPPLRLFSSVEEYVERLGGKRVIKKVLIANNGIAAVKGIRFIRRWAYEMFGDDKAVVFVAMATPEDIQANAEYIRMADQFVEVPGGSNNNNYANVDLIVTLASENGCQAVWAGWGHASENPRLPKNLLAKGISLSLFLSFFFSFLHPPRKNHFVPFRLTTSISLSPPILIFLCVPRFPKQNKNKKLLLDHMSAPWTISETKSTALCLLKQLEYLLCLGVVLVS